MTDSREGLEQPGEADSGPRESSDREDQTLLGPSDRVPMLRQVVVADVKVLLPETFGRLFLSELDPPKRSLSIPISLEQAGIIAGILSGKGAPRPMTGDLLCDIMAAFDLSVEVVQITGRSEGVYLGQVTVVGASGRPKMFPCRPSDGVIVALGQALPVPILVDESLLG